MISVVVFLAEYYNGCSHLTILLKYMFKNAKDMRVGACLWEGRLSFISS